MMSSHDCDAAFRSAVSDLDRALFAAHSPMLGYSLYERLEATEKSIEDLRKVGLAIDAVMHMINERIEAFTGALDYAERREMTGAFGATMDEQVIPAFARVAADLQDEIGHVEPYVDERLTVRSQGVGRWG